MRYSYIKQKDITDCGIACIRMIAENYGIHLKAAGIREVAKTDKDGTTVFGMKKAAEHFGFLVKAIHGNKEAIESKFTLPAIAHVVTKENNSHYVVLYEINEDNILIADPGDGVKKIPKESFLSQWTGVIILMSPGEKIRYKHQFQIPFLRYFSYISEYKKELMRIIAYTIVLTILGVFVSFYYSTVIDQALPDNDIEVLNLLSLGAIGLYLIKTAIEFVKTSTLIKLNSSFDSRLMSDYFQHIVRLPLEFFGNKKMGEIISRFIDIMKIREAIVNISINFCADFIMAIFGLLVLLQLNRRLIVITLISLLAYGVVVLLYNKPIKGNSRKQLEENSIFNSYLAESISGIETTKTCTLEQDRIDKMCGIIRQYLNTSARNGLLSFGQINIVNLLNAVTLICVFWMGTISVMKGRMTIGELITFNSVIVYFMDPIKNLIQLQPGLSNGIVAAERLDEILDLQIEKDCIAEKGIDDFDFKGDIVYKNIDFRYGMREKVLCDINLKIGFGESVAFVGESGSGKSTLAKLLVKLYQVENGTIKICNTEIGKINSKLLRKKIAYVSQDVFLYSSSIRDNITMGNIDFSEEELETICDKCLVKEFADRLPQGLDTMVGEKGLTLSVGQRQKIAIARAILRKPDILILDEATSNLDLISEKKILKEVNDLKDITKILIAHRLHAVSGCDNIIVLKNGSIVEAGKHEELLKKGKIYKRMWDNGLNER